jgi:hypothetical protein
MFTHLFSPPYQTTTRKLSSACVVCLALALAASLISACAASTQTPEAPVTPAFDESLLLRTWYYDINRSGLLSDSHASIYAAEGQPLPPARGRTGMIFEKGGKYTYIGIAPADGPLYFNGSWRWIAPTMLVAQHGPISYQGASFPAVTDTLTILNLSAETLHVRRRKPR